MNCEEARPLLHAYHDRELDLREALAIERHLESCAECRSRYEQLEQLRQEIADADLAYRPPLRLEQRIRGSKLSGKQSWWTRGGLFVAAAAAVLALVFIIPTGTGDGAAGEFVDSHMRSLQPGHLVDVPSSDQHTVKPWFQGRISFAP